MKEQKKKNFEQGEKGDMGGEGEQGVRGDPGIKGKEGPPGDPGLTGVRVSDADVHKQYHTRILFYTPKYVLPTRFSVSKESTNYGEFGFVP